jgi:small subunit ribosomal protein S27Ae
MQLFVNCLGQTRCIEYSAEENVSELLSRIQGEFNVEAPLELYSSCGKIESLVGLCENANVFACVDLIGGGKKKGGKKRKAYATPKKNKHKHKNSKLQALSYYAFSKDKVEPVKKLCTQDTCRDKGIFMANHWNRHYCGRCHLALAKLNAPKEEPKKVKAAPVKVEEKKEETAAGKGGKKGKK